MYTRSIETIYLSLVHTGSWSTFFMKSPVAVYLRETVRHFSGPTTKALAPNPRAWWCPKFYISINLSLKNFIPSLTLILLLYYISIISVKVEHFNNFPYLYIVLHLHVSLKLNICIPSLTSILLLYYISIMLV